MSTQMTDAADRRRKLAYLTKDYLPDARWTVGGALRFDQSLLQFADKLARDVNVRAIHQVLAAPPCLWSLDWFSQRRPVAGPTYLRLLESYVKAGIGFILEFDNPFVTEDDLKDNYSLQLVAELAKRNAAHQHAVCVASDRLAEYLRTRVPGLPIHCHVNRLLAEPATTTRDAAYYKQLLQRYNRVCLHPADAVNPAIYSAIAEPARMDVVMNDPCLRSCPLRREHLQVLADYRHEPYNPMHAQRRFVLMNQVGCFRQDGSALQQKRACNLTKAECRALYAAGYRSFVIQAQQFRKEITLMWDIAQSMFESTPELSNKVALITASLLATLQPNPKTIASGLRDFATTDID